MTEANAPHAKPSRLPRVIVRPSSLILVLLLVVAGSAAHAVHWAAATLGAVTMSNLDPAWFVALFAGGWVALMVVHELGHVSTFLALGKTWEQLKIGAGLSVLSPEPRSYRDQLLISAAGPILELAAGVLILGTTPIPWTLTWLLGVIATVEGVGNLLLPLGRNSDGWKVFHSAWWVARGHARTTRRPSVET